MTRRFSILCTVAIQIALNAVVSRYSIIWAAEVVAGQEDKRSKDWKGPEKLTEIQLRDLPNGPEGVRIAEDGFRAIYKMNRDGSDIEFFAAAPSMIVSTDPHYSSDGKQAVFCAFPNLEPREDGKIYVVNTDKPMVGIMRDLGYGMEPAWSPDDKQIAFAINPGNPIQVHEGVWVMDADGTHHRWLAEGYYPRWSPDAKEIVFQMWEGGGTLGLVDVATGKIRNLLEGTGWTANSFSGAWSPDGKQILFAGQHLGHDRMAIVDLSKAEVSLRTLTTSEDPKIQFRGPAAWSPDGKQAIFYYESPSAGKRGGVKSFLCSMSPEVPCGPIYLEPERRGNINRAPSFSPDSKFVIFSSER